SGLVALLDAVAGVAVVAGRAPARGGRARSRAGSLGRSRPRRTAGVAVVRSGRASSTRTPPPRAPRRPTTRFLQPSWTDPYHQMRPLCVGRDPHVRVNGRIRFARST